MKRFLPLTLAALLALAPCALAEGGLIGALATSAPTEAPTSAPTAEPSEPFEADGLRIPLPAGFEPLTGDALAAYEAAVQSDYPGAAETILAATSEDLSAALIVAAVDSKAKCLDAAKEAAKELLDDADAAKEARFGENEGASLSCAIDGQPYRLYFFSNGKRLIVIGATGMEVEEIEDLLAGLRID